MLYLLLFVSGVSVYC